jgi:hypothetical protein
MAINEIILKKVGRELREWIYLGVKVGMLKGVSAYRSLQATDPIAAQLEIERAIDLPSRAKTRINTAITIYGLQTLVDALAASGGTVTISELNTELATLETYAAGLITRRLAGEAWDSLATDIETNIEDIQTKWVFPLPANYKDVWGK